MSSKERAPLLPQRDASSSSSPSPAGTALSAYLGLATTMMGSVILALPGTIEAVGIVPGLLLFVVAGAFTFLSFEMLCFSCARVGEFSYEALSAQLFTDRSRWLVRAMTGVLLFGSMVTYMVIAMDVFEPFVVDVLSRNAIGWLFVAIATPLCLREGIHALRYTNLLVLLCMAYILVAVVVRGFFVVDAAMVARIEPNPANAFQSQVAALAYVTPIISLSYACQLNIPRAFHEVQQDRVAMRKVHLALVATGLVVYASFAIIGFLCFHGHPPSDILTGFSRDDTLINAARLCLGASVVLKSPMTFMPLRHAVEHACLGPGRVSLPFRAVISTSFMVAAHLVSMSSSNLGVILSVNGALAGATLTITVPGMFLYKVSQRRTGSEQASAATQTRLAVGMIATGICISVISLSFLLYNAAHGVSISE